MVSLKDEAAGRHGGGDMIETGVIFKGFVMGVILAVTTPPATLWMVQTGLRRGWGLAHWAALGVGAGYAFLGMGVGYCLLLLEGFWPYLDGPARILALGILAWLSWRAFRAPGAPALRLEPEVQVPRGGMRMLLQTGHVLVTMPMRIPAVLAYMVATAMFHRFGGFWQLPDLGLGTFGGCWVWGGFICVLGMLFAGRVDDAVILKSLNKLNRLTAYVYAMLLLLTGLPLLWAE